MIKKQITAFIQKALQTLINSKTFALEELPKIELQKPTNLQHGDFSTNLALTLAKSQNKKPRELAEPLVAELSSFKPFFSKIEIAGPGFINFTLSDAPYQEALAEILKSHTAYGKTLKNHFSNPEQVPAKKILIEYVSANPTGPMHVGHGRGAVVGDVIARLLAACGAEVSKEFYVNDHGVQIRTLGNSVLYYLKKRSAPEGTVVPPPQDSYQGEYLEELVEKYHTELEHFQDDPLSAGKYMGKDLLEKIKEDLALIHIQFDHFFLESGLYESGAIEQALHQLKTSGYLFEEEGALWFRSTVFGDDKDRVLTKQDKSYTYFTPDIAYHADKFERHFDEYINIWGADHGGYVPRIKAAIEALGHNPDQLKVLLIQMVNLKRGSERVQMSKRSGTYVTLREIVEEVGPDATRFFFISRSANSQLDFDLELAKSQSADNPVFYVQYAHARIASIFKKSNISEESVRQANLSLIHLPEERALIHKLVEYPEMLTEAAQLYEPHRICFYLLELAKLLQTYYSRAKQDTRYKVITEDQELTKAKLALLSAVKIVLANALDLLGVNAPEWMQSNGDSNV